MTTISPSSPATTASKRPRRPKGGEPTPPARPLTKGADVIRWIQRHCRHPDGEWIGQPLILEPWQRQLILDLFEVDPSTSLRRYRWALIGTPKKQGKTTLAAAIALYLLIGDGEPSPLVVCAAASEEQADLVFGSAKRMAELSPALSQITDRYDKEILVPSIPGARMRRVAAVAGTNDGQNISACVLDELHEWMGTKGEQVWHVLTNGTGARRQPLVLQITTAGYDLESIAGQQYTYGRRVESGEVVDRAYFFRWWGAPIEADWRDPETWKLANPNYGVTVHESFFRDQLRKPESIFRRYFCNSWVATEHTWLAAGAWDACRDTVLDLDPSLPAYVGIDVGLTHDSSAVAVAQRQGERVVLRTTVWENPYNDSDPRHDDWRFSLAVVENHCREIYARFPMSAAEVDGRAMPGPEFAYDKMFFERSAQLLEGDGLTMVDYPQSDLRMIAASQSLHDLVASGRLAHDGDATLARHVANALAQEKPRGWRLSKVRGSKVHIDGVIAAAIACYRAQTAEAPRLSVYETRGILVI